MNATAGKIIIDGNAAAALGCVFAGATVVIWYPITPSSSLVESMIGYLKRFRIDKETGKATYAVVQAEDELSAIGMVLGAGWAGARSVTSTAGPGISLMAEFVGLGYYAEIPAVIFDVQRVGPSTGFPRAPRKATSSRPRCCPMATPGIRCCFPVPRKNASAWPSKHSIWRSNSRLRCL